MKNKNTNLIWGIVVVAIIVILTIVMVRTKNDNKKNDINNYTDIGQVQVEGTEDVSDATKPVANNAVAMTYQQALTKYKDTRIQFDGTCQATPNNMTFKNGTTVMLDNRANVARNINIDGPVSIKAYGFKIVKLSSNTLPKKILVDCGTGQNVATILLQK